jgi:hypothetical protein
MLVDRTLLLIATSWRTDSFSTHMSSFNRYYMPRGEIRKTVQQTGLESTYRRVTSDEEVDLIRWSEGEFQVRL